MVQSDQRTVTCTRHARAGGLLRRAALLAAALLVGGCATGPSVRPLKEQVTFDRRDVEYPPDTAFVPYVSNLTAPTAIAVDSDGTLLIAESGAADDEPRILGVRNGQLVNVFPLGRRIPFNPVHVGFELHGPIGGMVADHHKIYISHRDSAGRGVITQLGYDGSHKTIVADLPAEGDYGVTDLALAPDGRIWFGVGSATNSGIVGGDNWAAGWLKYKPDVADQSYVPLELLGLRFNTPNYFAGLFGGTDIAVTGPFQAFRVSTLATIPKARNGKPNAAIYSVDPNGGDEHVVAHGMRCPRGIAFTELGIPYATNNGMELRGSRPVINDPDVLVRLFDGSWYGWPDFTADLHEVTEERFQPPPEMLLRTGFPKLTPLINLRASDLHAPDRDWVKAKFPSLSGAAKFVFVPAAGPLGKYRGDALVALMGDRAPFATSGRELLAPVGFKIVRVNFDTGKVEDFIHNTRFIPASRIAKGVGIERPIDVKFGPDGTLYVLDFGRLDYRSGRPRIGDNTGQVYKLVATREPATRP